MRGSILYKQYAPRADSQYFDFNPVVLSFESGSTIFDSFIGTLSIREIVIDYYEC